MGAWGYKSFENDAAADWVYEFEAEGPDAIGDALDQVLTLEDDDYLEAPAASAAIAAAEVVAAAKTRDLSKLSDEAKAAVEAQTASRNAAHFSATALGAMERVMATSELKDLWDESKDAAAWRAEMDALMARLR